MPQNYRTKADEKAYFYYFRITGRITKILCHHAVRLNLLYLHKLCAPAMTRIAAWRKAGATYQLNKIQP